MLPTRITTASGRSIPTVQLLYSREGWVDLAIVLSGRRRSFLPRSALLLIPPALFTSQTQTTIVSAKSCQTVLPLQSQEVECRVLLTALLGRWRASTILRALRSTPPATFMSPTQTTIASVKSPPQGLRPLWPATVSLIRRMAKGRQRVLTIPLELLLIFLGTLLWLTHMAIAFA